MIIFIYFFIFSLFLGSFLLVAIERYSAGRSFVTGRSICDYCSHTLAWYDLLPVVSFLSLKGHCRYCHKSLPAIYPLFEIGTAVFISFSLTQLVPLFILPTPDELALIIFFMFILCAFILTFFIDLKVGLIPFFVVLPAIGIVVVKNALYSPGTFLFFLLSGIGAFAFLFLIFLLTKGRGMGFGDCVFALLMGLLLGYPNIITSFYIAFLTGAFVSLILILWRKKKLQNGTIPFGPFLVLGTYLSLLYGDSITNFCVTLLFH